MTSRCGPVIPTFVAMRLDALCSACTSAHMSLSESITRRALACPMRRERLRREISPVCLRTSHSIFSETGDKSKVVNDLPLASHSERLARFPLRSREPLHRSIE